LPSEEGEAVTGYRVLALFGTLALVGLAAAAPPPGDDWGVPQLTIFGAVLLGGILWPYIERCGSEGRSVEEVNASDSRARILRGLLWRLAVWTGGVYLAAMIYESVLRAPNTRGTFLILFTWCLWGWIGETWNRAREGAQAPRCLEPPTVPSRRA
jgi:hypothetical protein